MTRENGQGRRILAGGLIIAVLVTLLIMTFVIDRVIVAFDDRYTIVAIIPEAPLLTPGSKVWIGGKEVGKVLSIGFMPTAAGSPARVSLLLDLPQDVREHVRTDSRVRLTKARLVGEGVVDIIPGTPDAQVLQPGDTLVQRNAVTVAELTADAARVRAQLDTALVSTRTIMPLVKTRMAATRTAFASLDAAMADGKSLAADARGGPAMTLMNDPAFSASLQRVRAHSAELPRMFAALRSQTGAPADTRAALGRLQARADTLGTHLDRIAAMMNTPNGSLSRFQNDSALVRALRAARADLDSLIAESRRNPLRFVF